MNPFKDLERNPFEDLYDWWDEDDDDEDDLDGLDEYNEEDLGFDEDDEEGLALIRSIEIKEADLLRLIDEKGPSKDTTDLKGPTSSEGVDSSTNHLSEN